MGRCGLIGKIVKSEFEGTKPSIHVEQVLHDNWKAVGEDLLDGVVGVRILRGGDGGKEAEE